MKKLKLLWRVLLADYWVVATFTGKKDGHIGSIDLYGPTDSIVDIANELTNVINNSTKSDRTKS